MWFMRFLSGLSGFYLAFTQRHSAAEPQPKGRRNGDAANDQKPNAKYQNRIGKAPAKMRYDGAMHLSALRVDICSGIIITILSLASEEGKAGTRRGRDDRQRA